MGAENLVNKMSEINSILKPSPASLGNTLPQNANPLQTAAQAQPQ